MQRGPRGKGKGCKGGKRGRGREKEGMQGGENGNKGRGACAGREKRE